MIRVRPDTAPSNEKKSGQTEPSVEKNSEQPIQEILVYAPEKAGLSAHGAEIRQRNFHLSFEPFNTQKRFNEFDGVIVFQGSFESIKKESDLRGYTDLSLSFYEVELTKRIKELNLLFQKGGFICVLLWKRFVDSFEQKDWSNTDLAKILLNMPSSYRTNYSSRMPSIQCSRSEFSGFLEIYGAAWSHFTIYNKDISLRPIATYNNELVGMIILEQRFFVPVLLPENRSDRVYEFFSLLTEALVAVRNKLVIEVPEWASKFVFKEEESLFNEKANAIAGIGQISTKLDMFQQFKGILVHGNELLVDSVVHVLSEGFGLKIKRLEEYREDLQILDDNGAPLVFCEVKGVNRGVAREYVNQADSQRERAGLLPSFPAVLIINTHIKKSRNLEEKDQDVTIDQVQHAAKNNVLIIRTLDLLRLLRLSLEGGVSKEAILQLFSSGGGWLKVSADKWDLIKG